MFSSALRVLLRKEFLQIRRDPVILRMLLVMPIIQLIVLANAATFEIKDARLWVVDQDHTPTSREAVTRLSSGGRFAPVGQSNSFQQAEGALLSGKADVVLVAPEGFERSIVRDREGTLQMILNAENGPQAGVIQAYGAQILGAWARDLTERSTPQLQRATGPEAPPRRGQPIVEVRRRGWYNVTANYKHYMVPGILAQLITLVGTLMTALNIVREKELGTLDQLNVTPIPRAAFITAKLLPLWIIALFELTVGLAVGHFLFGMPVVGSVGTLYFGAALYLVAALGLGLLISTLAETQQQAVFVTFALMMVYSLMSGIFTPTRGMPSWVRNIAELNPLLHFVDLARAVLLKGAGFADVRHELVMLALAGSTILAMAVLRYRKRAA